MLGMREGAHTGLRKLNTLAQPDFDPYASEFLWNLRYAMINSGLKPHTPWRNGGKS